MCLTQVLLLKVNFEVKKKRQTDRQTDRETDSGASQTDRQWGQTDSQTDREPDRQAGREGEMSLGDVFEIPAPFDLILQNVERDRWG